MTLISSQSVDERLETLYGLVDEDEDARSCRDLDDSACHWVPRNFFVYLFSNTLTKLGDSLASPKTVLAWESGSMLLGIFSGAGGVDLGPVAAGPLRRRYDPQAAGG